MTVQDLLSRLTSKELSEWMAYYGLEPWGCEMEDRRAGTIAATVANVHRNPKKKSIPYHWDNFFVSHKQKLVQSVEDQIAALKGLWG